jgi:hypothetical protein
MDNNDISYFFSQLKEKLRNTTFANYPIAVYVIFYRVISDLVLESNLFFDSEIPIYNILQASQNIATFKKIAKYSTENNISLTDHFLQNMTNPRLKKYLKHLPNFNKELPTYLESLV